MLCDLRVRIALRYLLDLMQTSTSQRADASHACHAVAWLATCRACKGFVRATRGSQQTGFAQRATDRCRAQ